MTINSLNFYYFSANNDFHNMLIAINRCKLILRIAGLCLLDVND